MELDFDTFMKHAFESKKAAPIGGRCSVFAKSDRVTAGARGFGVKEIARGLHLAVARTFASNIVKQSKVGPVVAMHCKLADNAAMRDSLDQALKLAPGTVKAPAHASARSALGAARMAAEDVERGGKRRLTVLATPETIHTLFERLDTAVSPEVLNASARSHLDLTLSVTGDSKDKSASKQAEPALKLGVPIPDDPSLPEWGDKTRDVVIGIDIGSRSTCILAYDPATRDILYMDYLNTAGQPLKVTLGGLKTFRDKFSSKANVIAVGTTGSSRDFIRRSINGDFSIDEITAQAAGTFFHAKDKNVKIGAVFEIGGQDSKFIVLQDGVITQFAMNKICSAGTGTFLEEIARPLNVDYRGEFQTRALKALSPSPINARCTVFMRSECQDAQRRGDNVENILAGVARAIARNYLDTFPEARPLVGKLQSPGNEDVFIAMQGGTFRNRSIIAAFENVLDYHHFFIPTYCDMTGALGMALVTTDWLNKKKEKTPDYKTPFNLNNLATELPEQTSFECKKCANYCAVTRVVIPVAGEADRVVYSGDICERYSSGGEGAGDGEKKAQSVVLGRNTLVFGDAGAVEKKNESKD
jgi:predicted CoA-substrate-specific enzyme activase